MDGREARQVLEYKAREAGFDLVGVARAEPLKTRSGCGGGRNQGWPPTWDTCTARPSFWQTRGSYRRARRAWFRWGFLTILAIILRTPETAAGWHVTRGGGDYHEVIKARLWGLRQELEEALGCRIRARGFTDAVPLMERSAAQHAGLGFFGRNACLINREVGSYFFIADLIVDLDLEPHDPGGGTCGQCTRCIDKCPTGAIKAPGVVDARLCISYLTIENGGEIPRELRPLVGDWAFGCDICQEVCPYNKRKAQRSRWPEFSEEYGEGPYLSLVEVLEIRDEEEFEERFSGTPLTRPGRAGLLRNCCVAAGNLRLEEAVSGLGTCLREDPSWLVRGYAAWALGEIGGGEAEKALEGALENESDEWCQEEIGLALKAAAVG